jgi:hypothetical protein
VALDELTIELLPQRRVPVEIAVLGFPLGPAGSERLRRVGICCPPREVPASRLLVEAVTCMLIEYEATLRPQEASDLLDRAW